MPQAIRSLLLLSLFPVLASAAPPRAGGEFAVNTYTTGNQFMPDVAADGSGRFVIVWEGAGQDGSQSGIFGQRFSAGGTPLGPEFRVNVVTPSNQFGPRVAANAAGNFVVVWTSLAQDGDAFGVFGRAYDAAGNALGGEFQVNAYTTLDQSDPAVSIDAVGNVVVVWASDGADGSSLGVRGRRFDASGTALGDEFAVNTFTENPQDAPSVAAHADGGFVVSWQSFGQDGSARGVVARRFAAGGTPQGGEFPVNTHVFLAQDTPQVAALPGGAFAVVWRSNQQDGNVSGIFARRFDELGNPGSEFQVNTFTTDAQQFPQIAADPSGAFTIVWEGWSQDGSQAGVFGRSFDAAGTPVDVVEFRVNTYTPYSQRFPAVAADADGRFVVAWHSDSQDGNGYGVRAQRFGDLIFKDGVESGALSAWSAAATDGGQLSVTATAALAGTTFGLQGHVDDVNPLYVQDDSPADEGRYRARFYLDPNGFDPGEAQLHRRLRTLIAFSEAPTRRVAAIVLRRIGGAYSLRARTRRDDDTQADTPFFPIDDRAHAVEFELVRASGPDALDGAFELWIDGVSVVQMTGLDNSLSQVDFTRMGALSVKAGANGTIYWDEFESRRLSPIGVLP